MARSRRIASLAVSVTANTTKFRKAMNDVSKRLERFSKRVAAASAAGFAAATAGMTAMIARSAAAIDRIAKMGVAFSLTTKEMATFELAADRSGVKLETFARGARQLASVRFDAVTKESKEAIELFNALGISVTELQQLDQMPALLARVAKQFDAMPDSADKAALAMKLLGGRAAQMMNAFVGGGAAIELAAKDAERFGLVVRENLAKSVQDMRDQFDSAQKPLVGFQRQLTAGLSPAFIVLGKAVEQALLKIADQFGGVEEMAYKTAIAIGHIFERLAGHLDQALVDIQNIMTVLRDPGGALKRGAMRMAINMVPGGGEALRRFDERENRVGPIQEFALEMRREMGYAITEARAAREAQRRSEQAAAVNPATAGGRGRGTSAAHREEARLMKSLAEITERLEKRKAAAEANKPSKEDRIIELLDQQNRILRGQEWGLN